jgi:hypothetical protein
MEAARLLAAVSDWFPVVTLIIGAVLSVLGGLAGDQVRHKWSVQSELDARAHAAQSESEARAYAATREWESFQHHSLLDLNEPAYALWTFASAYHTSASNEDFRESEAERAVMRAGFSERSGRLDSAGALIQDSAVRSAVSAFITAGRNLVGADLQPDEREKRAAAFTDAYQTLSAEIGGAVARLARAG